MPEPRTIELLIHSGIVVTMNPERLIIEDGAVAIDQGRITDVGDSKALRSQYSGKKEIDATHKIVMPGLVNLHFHADNFSRGVGEHLGLEEWIDTIYYPMLAAMTPDDAYKTAMLAYSEVIKGGTTTVNDMYIKLPSLADAAEKTGIRAVLSSEGADLIPGQETLEDNERAFLERNNTAGGRILVVFGIEWIPVCSAEYIKKCRSLADKYGVGVHVHLNESKGEVQLCKEKYGKPPVEFVNDLGLLGPDVVAAHCVWLSDPEIELIAKTGTHISHNPVSNAKLGNGVARTIDYLKAGINVGLGTDDAPCNNNNDMFEVMKYASLFQKAIHTDASLLPSWQILEMATINGARALGLDKQIGSLEAGKKADVILVDTWTPALTPVFHGKNSNVLPHLVYVAHGDNVDTTIVDGRILMEGRKLLTVDENQVIEEATRAAHKVIQARKIK
ncbi:MAG: amidohydrolase [Coprothermobacterota bacterium]|nr:amidohydrolase [Coprothermobacterota bacterium]